MSTEALKRAIASQETQARLAALLGVRSPSISEWLRRGVPVERCAAIECAVRGVVRCEELRPDVEWIRDKAGAVTGYQVRLSPLRVPVERVA